MDIERKAFEEVFPCSTGTVLSEYGHYESQINQQDAMIQNISWVVWQAAKAQAVPDGFVVVPVNYECVWCGCTELDGWTDETMIEAQEPAND